VSRAPKNEENSWRTAPNEVYYASNAEQLHGKICILFHLNAVIHTSCFICGLKLVQAAYSAIRFKKKTRKFLQYTCWDA
jgi:hypothetical protein